jgi:hypothetical protein
MPRVEAEGRAAEEPLAFILELETYLCTLAGCLRLRGTIALDLLLPRTVQYAHKKVHPQTGGTTYDASELRAGVREEGRNFTRGAAASGKQTAAPGCTCENKSPSRPTTQLPSFPPRMCPPPPIRPAPPSPPARG